MPVDREGSGSLGWVVSNLHFPAPGGSEVLSHRSTTPATVVGLVGSALVATTCLTGCWGGGQPDASATAPSTASTAGTASSAPVTPQAAATGPGDLRTTTTASALPVPANGPAHVANFPVPKGVKVHGPRAQSQSWQFDIRTKDTDAVLAFYRNALVDEGYNVQYDVNVTIGIEKIHYDIQFSGKARGYIVADKAAHDVFVLVQSLPTG